MTPREKVLRELEAIRSYASGYGFHVIEEMCRKAKENIAAADVIPDAPVADEICDGCGVRKSYHGGNGGDFTDERSCSKFLPPSKESPPVPSRAELIELMCKAFSYAGDEHKEMARVLDALIKAGAVR